MRLRLLRKDEHGQFLDWYKYMNRRAFSNALMSDFIVAVEDEETKELGCAVLVNPLQGAKYCYFTFLTRNPFNKDSAFVNQSIDYLINNFGFIAKDFGYDVFISTVGDNKAKDRYIKNGLKESSRLTMFWGEA